MNHQGLLARRWYDKENNRYFSDTYHLKAEGTRYPKEFAAFLKGVYGDELSHAEEWLVFPENIGESICIDETATSIP